MWALAWPAVTLNMLQVINSLLDNFFVRDLTADSLSAYSASLAILFLMFSLAMSLASAATAIVARAYGAGDHHDVPKAAGQALVWAFLVGCLLLVVGELIAPHAAKVLLPADATEAAKIMVDFQRIYALGIPFTFMVQAIAACLRGVGDTKSPMWISGIQICIHICLNFFLILPKHGVFPGAGLGVRGAATAMSLSAGISAILYLYFARRTGLGHVNLFQWPQKSWGLRLWRIGVPTGFMSIVRVGASAVLTIMLTHLPDGKTAISALRPSFSLESIMFMPSFGVSMAITALVGQSLGMKRPERAERLTWTGAHYSAALTVLLCIPIFVWAPQITSFFVEREVGVAHLSVVLIRCLCATEVGFAYAIVLTGAMQGAGDAKRPLWITIVSLWLIRVPLIAVLMVPLGAIGAWYALGVSQAMMGGITAWVFKRGQWKLAKV